MDSKIGNSVAKSFKWVSIERISFIGIQFLTMMVLSRLLSKEDFGTIGILAVFIALSNMLVDSGMGGALIRQPVVEKKDLSTLFNYNLLISIIIYAVLFLSAGYIALFYNIPHLKYIIRILGLTIIINALGIIQIVVLTRSLNFKKQAIVTLLSQSIASMSSIVMAFYGFGVWALVFLSLLQSCFNVFFLYIVNKYTPSFIFSFSSFKSQWNFGINLLGANILNSINANVISSMMGRFYSTVQVGLYVQSAKIQNLPVGILTTIVDKVAFPLMAKSSIDDSKILSIKLSRLIFFLSFPIFCIIIVNSEFIISFLLGKQWEEAGWILSLLSYVGLPLIVKGMSRNIIKSSGCTQMIFRIEFISFLITIISLFISVFISLRFVLYSLLFSSIASSLISFYYVSKVTSYRYLDQIRDVAPFLFIFFINTISCFFFKGLFEISGISLLFITLFVVLTEIFCLSYLFKINEVLIFINILKRK